MYFVKRSSQLVGILCSIGLIIGLHSTIATAQQVQSDYEIQKEFKEKLTSFQQQLEEADSSEYVKSIVSDVEQFEQNYNEHEELLDQVLYPETFEQKIDELKKSSKLTMNRLVLIEEQNSRMGEMETRLAGYESDLAQLDRRSDSLQQAMQKSVESEKQLSGMVRQYRESLEKRDELVLSFIDSLIIAYEQMDLESATDLENMDAKSRFESNGNALMMLYAISDENIRILKNNSAKLRMEDYMRMADVHASFDRMWTQLGDKITNVYQNDDAEVKAEQIDNNIAEWKSLLKDQIFTSIHGSLIEQGIELQEFSTSEGMYSTITTYLDEEIASSEEGATDENYEKFNRFKDFWNEVELKWASNLQRAEILTGEQLSVINQKIYTWSKHAEPRSNILVYLFGFSVLAIVTLSIFLVREKSKKK